MKTLLIIFGYLIILAIVWLISFVLYIRKQRKKQEVIQKITLTLPKSWQELTSKQLLYISNLFVNNNTVDEIQTKCFLYCSGIKVLYQKNHIWICKYGKRRIGLTLDIVMDLSRRFAFVTQKMTATNALPLIGNQKPIRSDFRGVSFKQWMAAENYFQAFIATKNEEWLYSLCAVIYSKSYYKMNDEFNDNETKQRLKDFRKASPAELYSTFIVYAGFKDTISKMFPYLFQTSTGESKGMQSGKALQEMFENMIYTLTDGDVTKYNDVIDAECWKAFAVLNRKAKENSEMKQRIEKIKKR